MRKQIDKIKFKLLGKDIVGYVSEIEIEYNNMAQFTIMFSSFDKKHKPTTTDLIIRIPLTPKQLKMLF